jgi:hypothetical protein
MMSHSGQTEKNSVRAYFFRVAPESGPCSMQFVPSTEVAGLPGISRHALACVTRSDAGELALERGGGGPAVQLFYFDGCAPVMAAVIEVIWGSRERKYFCKTGLDAPQIGRRSAIDHGLRATSKPIITTVSRMSQRVGANGSRECAPDGRLRAAR